METMPCHVCGIEHNHSIGIIYREAENGDLTGRMTSICVEHNKVEHMRNIKNENESLYINYRPKYVLERFYQCENGHLLLISEIEHKGKILVRLYGHDGNGWV